jgi:dienelactone hydrolase
MKSIRITILIALTLFGASSLFAATPDVLAGTEKLDWPEADLSERMMNGAHAFVERQIEESVEKRKRFWNYDLTSAAGYEKSVEPNRERLKKMIGVVDERVAPGMEFFGDDENPALVADAKNFQVFQVRWPVLEGVYGEGLLARPKTAATHFVVYLPDADQTPEQTLGLAPGLTTDMQIPLAMAMQGVEVLVPALVNRSKLETTDARLKRADQTHREWIYRQAFHMGRHIIGYEAQTALAGVDWFEKRRQSGGMIGVGGYGEGGLIALYAGACDPRIDSTYLGGYFGSRQKGWSEPIYRNVFGLLTEFGDAEIATLIAPRAMRVESSLAPEVDGHKGANLGPRKQDVQREVLRATSMSSLVKIISSDGGIARGKAEKPRARYLSDGTIAGVLNFDSLMGPRWPPFGGSADLRQLEKLNDRRKSFSPVDRHRRIFRGMESHVQGLVRKSEHVRDAFFLNKVQPELVGGKWSTMKKHPTHDPKSFIEKSKAYRKKFHEEGMGKFDEATLPFNARTRKVAETDKWTAYDVVLDVYPEVFAWGALLVPKDLKPGERRPVVVCQHGRNGLPRDTIDANKTAYNDFAAKLAERGFITFAPHNLYRGEDRYRWLDRKANAVGATLFSFIIAQHDQILKWLKTQPFVDGERMAFYGLSYGGETAVRVPAILEDYCLSICSGDFNQWTRKIAATDQPFSFMNTIEWEMPYWNLGHTFDYAEMAYLIFPRPFMVERGHHDRVGRDCWVAHEYGKVRWLYAQFGLEDKTEIEYFQGGHSINGQGTFDFLYKHLNWPKPD